ncbi:uncharacterized protein [Argopecten irradians]|uniref:uncharacterized protein n=1 Tax=Argopecten irradians TaxID=31199 RepID=UPI00371CAB88
MMFHIRFPRHFLTWTTLLRCMERELQQDANPLDSPETFLRTIGFPFIHALRNEIEDQFVCSPVLKSFAALDPRNLPENICDITDYGRYGKTFRVYDRQQSDTFQGRTTVSPGDLDSAEAVQLEYQAFKSHMFVESSSKTAQVSATWLKH